MSGVYADVSMYKDWIDKIMSSKKLPDYEHSPFPKPPQHNFFDGFFGKNDANGNSADRPKFMNPIAILFAVIISMVSNLV